MSSYIRQWKLNTVEAKCQRSKWFKQYSLVSGMVRGSICAWDRDYKDLFGLESSWGSNINGKCDICFTTRKWHHHSRDFITFSRSWPKTSPSTSHSSDILGLTSVDAPSAPSTDDGCLLSELFPQRWDFSVDAVWHYYECQIKIVPLTTWGWGEWITAISEVHEYAEFLLAKLRSSKPTLGLFSGSLLFPRSWRKSFIAS